MCIVCSYSILWMCYVFVWSCTILDCTDLFSAQNDPTIYIFWTYGCMPRKVINHKVYLYNWRDDHARTSYKMNWTDLRLGNGSSVVIFEQLRSCFWRNCRGVASVIMHKNGNACIWCCVWLTTAYKSDLNLTFFGLDKNPKIRLYLLELSCWGISSISGVVSWSDNPFSVVWERVDYIIIKENVLH